MLRRDRRPRPVFEIDAEDPDWIKRDTWDLPTTGAELRASIAASGLTVGEFKQLEVYKAHADDPDLPWVRNLWGGG